jgi:hypothetical protein
MSYKALVGRQVVKVFNLVKDLADAATLTRKEDQEFDFNKIEIKKPKQETIRTKIIVMKEETLSNEKKTRSKEILLKTNEVGDIALYDTIELSDGIWKVGATVQTDRFITIVKIYR